MVILNIEKALLKGIIPETIPVYKASDRKLNSEEINVFDINEEDEIESIIKNSTGKITLNKINIKEGTRGIAFSNIIFYDNKNKTLPVGMNLSTKMIIDTKNLHLRLTGKNTFGIIKFEDEKDDFSNFQVKEINVLEYETIDIEDLENE